MARRRDPARKIEDLLAAIEQKLNGDIKFTIGDYIRLLQVHQELERETPRNIEVTWVDSLREKSENGE